MITLLSYKNGDIMVPVEAEAQLFFQDHLSILQDAQAMLANELERMRSDCIACTGRDPVDHWSTRIKSADSTKSKLKRRGLPVTAECAVEQLHDLIGMRVVCAYVDDVYLIRNWIQNRSSVLIAREKDYVRRPKDNGYRSLHLLLQMELHRRPIMAELQLRTLAMDCWATLEHQLKYKGNGKANRLMANELKRCADEIASTDWNLLSIREMIENAAPQQQGKNQRETQHENTAR